MAPPPSPALGRGLSARLLALTAIFIMLAEILIYAPSIGRFRKVWLEDRLDAAHLASLAIEASPDLMVDAALQRRLLDEAQALGIVRHRPGGGEFSLGPSLPAAAGAVYDLRDASFVGLIAEAFALLARDGDRPIQVVGWTRRQPGTLMEVLVREQPLRNEMIGYSVRILGLSLFISLLAGALVFLTLQRLLVRPLRRLTENMLGFRQAPEDASRVIVPGGRRDEVGLAEIALAEMEHDLRAALTQKARLAAVGAAVTKIQHDLRGILASAMVVSDRLEASEDPAVRRLAPTLITAIDRASALCTRTMSYVRHGPPVVERRRFALAPLLDEVGATITAAGAEPAKWRTEVPAGFTVAADRDLLYRVLCNLGRNAVEAGAATITVAAEALDGRVAIGVRDDGPGMPPKAVEALFQPFAASARPGSSGLGLAIARELMAAQGGDIALVDTGAQGTLFQLRLPLR